MVPVLTEWLKLTGLVCMKVWQFSPGLTGARCTLLVSGSDGLMTAFCRVSPLARAARPEPIHYRPAAHCADTRLQRAHYKWSEERWQNCFYPG